MTGVLEHDLKHKPSTCCSCRPNKVMIITRTREQGCIDRGEGMSFERQSLCAYKSVFCTCCAAFLQVANTNPQLARQWNYWLFQFSSPLAGHLDLMPFPYKEMQTDVNSTLGIYYITASVWCHGPATNHKEWRLRAGGKKGVQRTV